MSDNLDFNQLPYFDDYSEDKLFQRILFKPGVAVQARELTQLQTILQKQIEKFGSHFFKNGSRILGGKFDPQDPIDYVRVALSSSATRKALVGKELTGSSTGVKGRVIYVEEDPSQSGVSVIFVRYTNTVITNDVEVSKFSNENLIYLDDESNTQTLPTESINTTGVGSIFGIGSGVLYVRGFFVSFASQQIAIDAFNSFSNKRVYFKSSFTTVNSNQDTSLLDNAQGFNNFNAPGADRLKCELTLVVSDLEEDLADESHTLLIELRNGEVYERQERTQYNEVMDEISKRTFDESGDYLVRGWDIFSREHLDTGSNGGLYTNAEAGDSNKLSIGIEKGLAYVKGFEVETITTRYLDIDKSIEFDFVNGQSSIVGIGSSTVVDEIVGLPDPDRYVTVNLYDTAENRVSDKTAYNAAASGSVIGTAVVGGFVEESGQFGQSAAQARIFLSEINMNSTYSFDAVRSIGNTSHFFADTALTSNSAILDDNASESRLYHVGSNYTRTVKDNVDSSDTTITFARETTGTVSTGGVFSSISLQTNESLPYGTGVLDTTTKNNVFLVVTDTGGISTSNLTGVVTVTGTNNIVTGTGDFTKFNIGDYIEFSGTPHQILSIESATSLTLTAAASAAASVTFAKHYIEGSIIDLNSKGVDNGTVRSVTATPTTLSIDLDETFGTSFDAKIIYRVAKASSVAITKNLRSNRFVEIDASTAGSLTKFWLGVSDVYRVVQVRSSNTSFTTNSDGTDVSSSFTLNTGQKESAYNTSFIKTNTAIANTDFLLVEFDYFEPDYSGGVGFFSIDSYPIDDTIESDTTIKTANIPSFYEMNLRNYLDCRPVKASTATPGSTVGTAPTNPSESTSYIVDTHGLRLPVSGTNIVYDYSYYLARRDVLAINSEGTFSIIEGNSSTNPTLPKISDSYMRIANIYVPPYPSFGGTYARILRDPSAGVTIDKMTTNRYTMRDIGKMRDRITDLEYYNALNLLETDIWDLTIPDENGLDRFKNGVFVDPFVDLSLSDAGNLDFKVAIDKRKKEARPTYTVDGFDSGYETSVGSVVKNDNLVTASFSEVTMINQPYATTNRNIEFSSYRFIGNLNLNPDVDTWVDVNTVDRTFDLNSDLEVGTEINTVWGAAEISSTGAVSGSDDWKIYRRYGGEGGRGGGKNDAYASLNRGSGLSRDVIAERLGLDPNERSINSLPVLYQALTDDELASRHSGTFKSYAAAKKWAWSNSHRKRQSFFAVKNGDVVNLETITEDYTGIETTITTEENLNNIGTFVTDASLIPYIRPQSIQLSAVGLKRTSRYYVFFDGVDMSNYCTLSTTSGQPGTYPPLDDYYPVGSEGDSLVSDAYGNLFCTLRLPAGDSRRFRVGTSEVVITDSTTNAKSSTSFAKANFVSSGLNLQKQRTILSTKTVNTENKVVTKTKTYTVASAIEAEFGYLAASCSGYSFYVDEADSVEGVFMSSVDIWISALSADYGVWFEIREMSNDGGITRNQVPYSEVWMYRNDSRLNISADGIADSTNVKFKAPVYLLNKTQYAFIIHTEGLNPDTYFWVSELGGNDVSSGNPVTSRPLTGTFYTTNNNLNWDIVPDVDLKVKFNRASFGGTSASPKTGTTTFKVEDVDYIVDSGSLPNVFFNEGEPVRSSEILQLSLVSSNVSVGDVLLSSNNTANGTIVAINGADYYIDGFDFIETDAIQVLDAANTAIVKDTGTVSTVNFGVGVIDKIVQSDSRFDIVHSNGKFFEGSVLRSILPTRHKTVRSAAFPIMYDSADTIIDNLFAPNGTITLPVGASTSNTTITAPTYTIETGGFTKFDYTAVLFRPSYVNFSNTTTNFTVKSRVSSSNTVTTSGVKILPNDLIEFDTIRTLLSRSVEVADFSGERSLSYDAYISTPSDYISPIIDSSLMGSVHHMNLLNDDVSNELTSRGSSLDSKYISKVVDLEDDNTAEDLLVILKEYRPATTGIKVWARIRSRYDQESIYQKDWVELYTTKSAVSSDINKRNYIDTTYQFNANDRTGSFNEVEYPFTVEAPYLVVNTSYDIVSVGSTDFTTVGAANNDIGTTFTANNVATGTGTVRPASSTIFTGYNQFQLKIGLTGSNAAVYPKIAQLRAISLQV